MGWLDYHLHAFRVKKPKGRSLVEIGIPDHETDRLVLPGWKIAVGNYMGEPGANAIYEYDFGDGWEHELLLEGVILGDVQTKYPVCVSGEGACPPEDCGGIPGYGELLKVLDHPGTDEYKSMVAWLKGHAKNYWPYRPRHFEPTEVQFWDPKKRWRIAFGTRH